MLKTLPLMQKMATRKKKGDDLVNNIPAICRDIREFIMEITPTLKLQPINSTAVNEEDIRLDTSVDENATLSDMVSHQCRLKSAWDYLEQLAEYIANKRPEFAIDFSEGLVNDNDVNAISFGLLTEEFRAELEKVKSIKRAKYTALVDKLESLARRFPAACVDERVRVALCDSNNESNPAVSGVKNLVNTVHTFWHSMEYFLRAWLAFVLQSECYQLSAVTDSQPHESQTTVLNRR